METNRLTWKIGGEAGYGIMVSGRIFSLCCSRGGLDVFDTAEFPSLIRGGHNEYFVRVEEDEIFSQIKLVNLLVALNKQTVDFHKHELTQGGGIIYDASQFNVDDLGRDDLKLYNVPLIKITEQAGGSKIMQNTVAIAASLAVVDYDFAILGQILKDIFKKKGKKIVDINIKAAKLGYDYIKKNYPDDFGHKLKAKKSYKRMVIGGNEAVALGAIRAGCKLFAAYPMTPSSGVFHYIAKKERDFNLIVKHTESEIAAINMLIGAGFAGVRAMTSTSGGGFALMTEGFGLAACTETPIVVYEAQRPGPSTGMPTHTEQADLRQVLHASQGDFARIVVAPGDVEECFEHTVRAFNLAEKYQLPTIILSDKYLAESHKSCKPFDLKRVKVERGPVWDKKEEFKRHKFTKDGVSPRSFPGAKGSVYRTTGNEHDEYGKLCDDPVNRTNMINKRAKKLESAAKDIPNPRLYGIRDADLTIICWGSTKGPVVEAMKLLHNEGLKVNFLHLIYLSPFPVEKVKKVIASAKKTLLIELNSTAQLRGLIREHTGKDVDHVYLKYDGRPFYPEDILHKVKKLI